MAPVSYTHLDVYKRQIWSRQRSFWDSTGYGPASHTRTQGRLRYTCLLYTSVMIIMSVIGAVAIIIIQSIRFGKRIKKQMQPVLDAIRQIKDQNLESVSYTHLKRIVHAIICDSKNCWLECTSPGRIDNYR